MSIRNDESSTTRSASSYESLDVRNPVSTWLLGPAATAFAVAAFAPWTSGGWTNVSTDSRSVEFANDVINPFRDVQVGGLIMLAKPAVAIAMMVIAVVAALRCYRSTARSIAWAAISVLVSAVAVAEVAHRWIEYLTVPFVPKQIDGDFLIVVNRHVTMSLVLATTAAVVACAASVAGALPRRGTAG